jgi:hypothetical protein
LPEKLPLVNVNSPKLGLLEPASALPVAVPFLALLIVPVPLPNAVLLPSGLMTVVALELLLPLSLLPAAALALDSAKLPLGVVELSDSVRLDVFFPEAFASAPEAPKESAPMEDDAGKFCALLPVDPDTVLGPALLGATFMRVLVAKATAATLKKNDCLDTILIP